MPAPFAFHQQLGQFALAPLSLIISVPLPGVDSEQYKATFREGGEHVQNCPRAVSELVLLTLIPNC